VRLVEAMDDSAIATFMASFSASRLNGLALPFLSFFLSLDELEKKPDPDLDDDFVWLKDWTCCDG
jgi:hypothetical protein